MGKIHALPERAAVRLVVRALTALPLLGLAVAGCSSSSSGGGGPPSGMDAGGGSDASPPAADAAATATDSGSEAGGDASGPSSCPATFAACDVDGGGCCSGLSCVNQAYCCESPGVLYGDCFTGADCCSGNCDNGATGTLTCCSGGGQLCDVSHNCCTGYRCGGNGTCCGQTGASCTGPGDCCNGTICGDGMTSGGSENPSTCCAPSGGSCATDSDCCFDVPNCLGGTCCKSVGAACTMGSECCSGQCQSDGTCY
jgi:hypothetical protein